MGQALYRKYRSKSLDEIVGQEHITSTLREALKQGRISHAYLFTGPRGVGKTSIARILAHEINGLAYDEGQTNLDIIEIDAASNRRIDEIRDLRDKVNIAPASAKYKVYIIDEVHMLTREAFNALLKTLEEPPAHAIFILATTEAHKLPETIISRTQRFIFKPASQTMTAEHLKAIAQKEGISIDDAALELLAEHGDGSFRDSISLLDQAGNHGSKIDLTIAQTMLGIPPKQAIVELLETVQASNTTASQLLQQLTSLQTQGFQASAIAKQLAGLIRNGLLNGSSSLAPQLATALLNDLLNVPSSRSPEQYLEIILLERLPLAQPAASDSVAQKATTRPSPVAQAIEPKVTKAAVSNPQPQTEVAKKPASATQAEPVAKTINKETSVVASDATEIWEAVLAELKKDYNTLYGVARMAQPDFSEDGKLTLHFAFAFHQKRLQEAKNRTILVAALKQASGLELELSCVHDPNTKASGKPIVQVTKAANLASTDGDSLTTINNIFGGGELLQS